MRNSSPSVLHNANFDFMRSYNELVRQAQSDTARFVIKKLKSRQKSVKSIAEASGLTVEQIEKLAA